MELESLVHAIVRGDMIAAREWIAEAQRSRFSWENTKAPGNLAPREMAIAAALTEMLAQRNGKRAPEWTTAIPALPELMVLDPGLEQMPRSFERARTSGPEPLRRRNLVALPDFLKIA